MFDFAEHLIAQQRIVEADARSRRQRAAVTDASGAPTSAASPDAEV